MRVVVAIFLLLCLAVRARTQNALPVPKASTAAIVSPEIIRVTIVPETDSVLFEWRPSTTINVSGYGISYFEQTVIDYAFLWNKAFFIPNSGTYHFTLRYPDVLKKPVRFGIFSYRTTRDSVSIPNIQQPVFTMLQYDSCESRMKISWTKYIGWGSKLTGYTVYRRGNGTDIPVGSNPPDDTISYDTVLPNTSYSYYIVASSSDGIISRSNDTSYYTRLSVTPGYISADKAWFEPNGKNPVTLQFSVDPNAEIRKYQLFVSDNPQSGFEPDHAPFILATNPVVLYDTLKSFTPRYYVLKAIDNCGNGIVTSNLATAMIPQVNVKSNVVDLAWNDYLAWLNGTSVYTIYRSIGGQAFEQLQTVPATTYEDDIKSLIRMQVPGNFCYYIESGDGLAVSERSRSATVCVDLSEGIFVPEAFTPNGDGVNDEFKPFFPFLPKDYVMLIYDRYGVKIYETSSFTSGWNGISGNGHRAPDGAYIYYIRYTSQNGKTLEKNGTFSLINVGRQ